MILGGKAHFDTDAISFLVLFFFSFLLLFLLFRGCAFVASGWCYRDVALAGWFGHGERGRRWKRVLREPCRVEGSIGHGGLGESEMNQGSCLGIHMGVGCTKCMGGRRVEKLRGQ